MGWLRILFLCILTVNLASQILAFKDLESKKRSQIQTENDGEQPPAGPITKEEKKKIKKEEIKSKVDRSVSGAVRRLTSLGRRKSNRNTLTVTNGIYSNSFNLGGKPVNEAYVIYKDCKQPLDFFEETINQQQVVLEDCIPSGNVFIAYQPERIKVEENHAENLEIIIARDVVRDKVNAIIERLFDRYGKYIVRARRLFVQ